MARRRKERRLTPAAPIRDDAWYDSRDLKLIMPWLGHRILLKAKESGALKYSVVPGDDRVMRRHLYRGLWVREWLESFPVRNDPAARLATGGTEAA